MGSVLVIDDDVVTSSIVSKVLQQAGWKVLRAASGDEGLQRFFEEPAIDLVVTDIFMPGLDGVEVVHRLKAARPDLRIIAISAGGVSTESAIFALREMGVDTVLRKPFSPAALLESVGSLDQAALDKGRLAEASRLSAAGSASCD